MPDQYHLYWGDLHRHSAVSDGEGALAEHFRVARDEALLDFYAMTDHAILTADPCDRAYMEPLKGPASITDARTPAELGDVVALHRISDPAWRELQDLVRRCYSPGQFVTLLGYEWSCARYGDRSVHFLRDDETIRIPRTLPELYRMLDEVQVMLTPHHTGYARGGRGINWNVHLPRLERSVEIVSLHGCSEEPRGSHFPLTNIGMGSNVPGGSVQDALGRGYHLGIVGGSDGHRPRDPFVLTGAYATELTREAIWEAIYNRRTVATTGTQRISLEFRMDGEWQGSLFATDTLPAFSIRARATAPIARVDLVSDGKVLSSWNGSGMDFTLEDRVKEPPERPDTSYYVRLLQHDGNLAWSSPIWVSYLPELPEARGLLYWLPKEKVRFEVSREREENGQAIMHLRCVNDNLVPELVSGVRFEVTGSVRAEQMDGDGAVDLAPGSEVERRFALPTGFREGDVAFGVRFTDADANRRLTRCRFLTHEGARRR